MAKSSPRKTPTLDQIDRNFQVQAGKSKLQWLDAFDRRLSLGGLAWPGDNRKKKHFRRLPDRAEKTLSEGVRILSCCPAGVFVSCFTDSPDISIRMKVADLGQMDHMTATGMSGAELYFREAGIWHPAGVARPSLTETTFERSLMEDAPRRFREFRVYLPLYKKVESIALGFERGARIEPAPAAKGTRPIFFYGTSITQGGCANTAGSDFVSTIGRMLDTEVINFGFSGNGKGEPEMARLVREISAEIFVLDFLANAEIEILHTTLPEFIRILREQHPLTPIVIMGCPGFDKSLWSATTRELLDRKRDTAMRTYLGLKDAGDANLHFIDGNGLLPAGITGAYVDGVHPTSHGFAIMAEHLAPQLRAIRLRGIERFQVAAEH
jgi:lysophospholipase L1-like esterase